MATENTDTLKQLADETVTNFVASLGNLKLNAQEALIVEQASLKLSEIGIEAIGANAERMVELKLILNLELAALANISVAKAVQAEKLLRQAAYDAFIKVLRIGIAVLIAV